MTQDWRTKLAKVVPPIMHFSVSIEQNAGQLEIITFYNAGKSSVDSIDQNCSNHSTIGRISFCRWQLFMLTIPIQENSILRTIILIDPGRHIVDFYLKICATMLCLPRDWSKSDCWIFFWKCPTKCRSSVQIKEKPSQFCPGENDMKSGFTCKGSKKACLSGIEKFI